MDHTFSTEQVAGNANAQNPQNAQKAIAQVQSGTRPATLYRRHTAACPGGECNCPVWMSGSPSAYDRLRISLKTRDWNVAEQRAHRIMAEAASCASPDDGVDLRRAKSILVARSTREVSHGSIGAASELLVCADLLSKGYEVFRSVSPSCSCDLIAKSKRRMLRVEVKTAGNNGHATAHASRFDVLALVVRGNQIVYKPDIRPIRREQSACSPGVTPEA